MTGAASNDSTPDAQWRRGEFDGTTLYDEANGRRWTSRLLHRVGDAVANSTAGVIAAILIALWSIAGAIIGFPEWWLSLLYAVTASVTFVMVFVIQHTQQRQTSATQRKLDELIRATRTADDSLISVEQAPDETLEALAERHAAERAKAVGTT